MNYEEKLRQAIIKRFGLEAVQDPSENWTMEKEEEYLKQLKALVKREDKYKEETVTELSDGVYKTSKLINRKNKITKCSICGNKCKTVMDDIYYLKYKSCEACYIKHIEARNGDKK